MKNKKLGFVDLQKESLKYNSRIAFKKNNLQAYRIACGLGIMDKICTHMTEALTKWSLKSIKKESLKHKTRTDFFKKASGAYMAAIRLGVLDDVCEHMRKPSNTSRPELELMKIIKNYFKDAKKIRHWNIQIPEYPKLVGFEIDIFIPSLKKGIEFNGDYWHGVGFRRNWTANPALYHNVKKNYFESQHIEIIEIKESEWISNKDLCIEKCIKFLSKE